MPCVVMFSPSEPCTISKPLHHLDGLPRCNASIALCARAGLWAMDSATVTWRTALAQVAWTAQRGGRHAHPRAADAPASATPASAALQRLNTLKAALTTFGPSVAEMITLVLRRGFAVATMKLALLAPAATVTLAGSAAIAALDDPSLTTTPPAGAGADRVIVAVEPCPP